MIIEKINNQELQEVADLDHTKRGNQGCGSSNDKAQGGKDHSFKQKIEINGISAKAFGQFYRRGKEIGMLRWDEVDNEIHLEAIKISTELAIKNKKGEDRDTKDIVPREYDHLLKVFEKGEKTDTTTPLTRSGPRN